MASAGAIHSEGGLTIAGVRDPSQANLALRDPSTLLNADIVSNDQVGVRTLLKHYRRIANAATLDEAYLMEGYLAETWQPGMSQVAERRSEVMARGRSQSGPRD